PAVQDTHGYWQTHLVLVLLNTLVVVAIARLALSIYGDRADSVPGFLAAPELLSSPASLRRRTRSSSRTRSSRGRRCSPRTSCCCTTRTYANVEAPSSAAGPRDWPT